MEEQINKGESNFSKYYVTEEFKETLKNAYQYKKIAKKAYLYILLIITISAAVLGIIVGLFSKGNIFGYIIGGILGLIFGIIKFNNDIKAYSKFYLANIPSMVASFIPLGVSNIKMNTNINYEATGLGELYTYNRTTKNGLADFALTNNNGDIATGKLYTIQLDRQTETRRESSSGRVDTQTSTDNVFTGLCYSLDVNNPVNCAIRIDSDETFVSQLTESTIEATTKNRGKFAFNSAELEKLFNCKVYPKGTSLTKIISNQSQKAVRDISIETAGGLVDNVLSGSKIGRTLNTIGVGDAIKNEMNKISIGDITSMFESTEDMEEAMLEARKLITPVVEEFLLYIRKKYGPFTLVINNGINIQISKYQTSMNKINNGQNMFKFTKDYMAGLLEPKVFSNDDLKCSTLTRLYDVFMLEWLLNKYFKTLTKVDQFSVAESAENRLHKDDIMFFEESLELDKRSERDIDNEAEVKKVFTEVCE